MKTLERSTDECRHLCSTPAVHRSRTGSKQGRFQMLWPSELSLAFVDYLRLEPLEPQERSSILRWLA